MWQEILKISTIGTERNTFLLPTSDDALGRALAELNPNDREGSLLGAAAAVGAYEQAGLMPQTAHQVLSTPSETDEIPICSALASHHLSMVLDGGYKEMLPEWLNAMAAASKRISEEFLPALLNIGKSQQPLREATIKVIGRRGLWLARQNPDWNYAIDEADESAWETGSSVVRLALLKTLRQTNPLRARELVNSTWAQETPEDRAAFLDAFLIGLSPDDEEFLEAALDDRRKEVRKIAADLLASLPESNFVKRMIARVRPLVTFEQKLLGANKIKVILPEACTKEMQRDGIELRPPNKDAGEKAWWLEQMVSAIPPRLWCEWFEKKPWDLCVAAQKSDWQALLYNGWSIAAKRWAAVDWLEAWLADQIKSTHINQFLYYFISLPEERREAFLLAQMDSSPLPDQTINWLLQDYAKFIWGEKLSLAVAHRLENYLLKSDGNWQMIGWQWQRKIAPYFNPQTIPEIISRLTPMAQGDRQAMISEFFNILQFRREMLKEIYR